MFSPSTTATALLSLAAFASAHCAVLDIHGSNGITGHGWGVNTEGKFPRSGTSGDAGADSTEFGTSDSPDPPCGRTSELGDLDPASQMATSESNGIPAAYNNGSVVMTVFQVDADGGGPMSCESNSDATLKSWQPMAINLNMAGNFGDLQQSNRVHSTVVATFASGTTCTGGSQGDACVIRCRAGVGHNFGSCFTAKLASKTFNSKVAMHASVNPGNQNAKRDVDVEERALGEYAEAIMLETRALFERAGSTIPKAQLNYIVDQVFKKMKFFHYVVKQPKTKRDLAQYLADELENALAE